ncbi:MAG: hypothetical protein ABIJ09_02555 [Pseudomonadota bacterium]
MKKSTTLIALTTLSLLPVAAMAALTLGESAGFLKGGGTTPTHDFPVLARAFSNDISAPEAAGLRTVKVSVPVEQISTDNYLRDVHMRSAIFGAGLARARPKPATICPEDTGRQCR